MSDTGTQDGGQDIGQGDNVNGETIDWEAEAKKFKAEAEKQLRLNRKVEDQNKANLKRLADMEAASLSDQDKAVRAAIEAAQNDTRAQVMQQFGHRLVDAEVKAAATGRGMDVDALLDGLDRSRFLSADMEPDSAAIAAWVEKIAPKRDSSGFDIGQGARGAGNGLSLAEQQNDPLLRDLIAKVGPPRR